MGALQQAMLMAGVSGGDPFFANVVFLGHMETTAFADVKGHTQSTGGSPTTAASATGFGNCIDFTSGGSSYSQYANSGATLDLGTGDYTIEFMVNPRSKRTEVYLDLSGGTAGANAPLIYQIGSSGLLSLFSNGVDARVISDVALALNTWTRVAVCCASGTTRMWIDGVLQLVTTAVSLDYFGCTLTLGAETAGPGTASCTARMDEGRITKGVARYPPTTYTPATAPFPDF